MRTLDWIVLAGTLGFIILYGLWRSRGSDNTDKYLRGERSMPWYAVALSIMATQASAITFISTTGQSYTDGMRFVQFYFGLPLAMILISKFVVPVFHRANVYTAYEYLERRFDAKTRALVSTIFLIQRGLAVGVALYAPAVVLTVIFGWSDVATTWIMGAVIVTYTVLGGIKAITWTDFQQMIIMLCGLVTAFIIAVNLLPQGIGFTEALALAGATGRVNPVTFEMNWNDRYNIWSGLLGGMFLALAYFGCDQSQVQRYLTGKSIAQSRLSLLFNAVAKIPMQFFILLTGIIIFAFYIFEPPPMLFHAIELKRVEQMPEYPALKARYDVAIQTRKAAALKYVDAMKSGKGETEAAEFREAQAKLDFVRKAATAQVSPKFNDTNYIFLSFVTKYLPAGVVGLIMAVIFAAAMSTISAEINSLATVSVIDIYKRFVKPGLEDRHYLGASKVATAFWGLYAIVTAQYGKNLGSLIEAVNMVGSLFYGGLLGVFALALFFPRVKGTAAFTAVLIGEAAIFTAKYSGAVSFLWFNVIGSVTVVVAGLLLSGRDRAS